MASPPPAQVPPQDVKVEKKLPRNNNDNLLLLTMMVEGVVFGSLYGWALTKTEGITSQELKKYLSMASVLTPLLLLDKDCCAAPVTKQDQALFSLHIVFALKTWFDRSLRSFGPWSMENMQVNSFILTIAFLTHLRGFLHLFTKEARGSLVKKLTLLVSMTLGINLQVW